VERRPVVNAMLRRDADAAEAAMRAHIRSTRNSIVEALLRYRAR
jgi:DNA-binding GntR family transcriptional regulator